MFKNNQTDIIIEYFSQNKNNKPLCYFVVPSIIGYSGDAVNERQLAKALSKFYKLRTYSFVQITRLCTFANRNYIALAKKDVGLMLLLPTFIFASMLSIIIMILSSFIIAVLSILEKPKLIYVRTTPKALPFIWLRRFHKGKVIVKVPSIIEDELRGSIYKSFPLDEMIFRAFLPRIDRYVIVHADWVAVATFTFYRELVRRRGVKSKNPPILLPAGVDLSKITKIIKNSEKKADESKIIVGFIGSLEWWQGVDILAKACSIVKNKFPNIKLLIIGSGNWKVLSLVESICKKENLDYEITGYLPHEEALKRLREVDVMVLPRRRISTTESNIPIKVIEAWALGIPVIVTRHKVFLESGIRDYEDVIFCEPQPLSVANAILTFLNDPVLREKLKVNGFKLALQFDYNRIAKKLLKIFEN
ncbi:MAG: glycosyltransferase [Thermofilaceae archaeon]